MKQKLMVLALVAGITGGCGIPGLPFGWHVSKTNIVEPIQAPATAKRGQPVQVVLIGGGANTCYSADRVDVQVLEAEKQVLLTPYVKAPQGATCGQMPIDVSLTATFTPRDVGTYHLEAKGWDRERNQATTWTAEVEVTD